MKSFTVLLLPVGGLLALLAPSASAEVLYDREGIQLQGTARIVSRNAASCNVLEEKYSPEEYEELKANQGRPLHVWQLDFSAHNNTGRTLDFLQANFDIQAPQPPCTNWSGEGPGRGPAGDFTDHEGNPGFVEPGGVSFKGLSRVSGMGIGEVVRDRMFMLVFHEYEPVFKRWSVNFNFAPAGSGESTATTSDQDPPRGAGRPRIQLPPDILADKYLRQAEQRVQQKDYEGARRAMEELVALQQEHGLEPAPEDHFRYAQIWSAAGSPEQAMEAGVRYLQIRGREAAHYDEAIDLINQAEDRQGRGESGPAASDGPGLRSTGIRVGETVVFDGMEFVGIPPGEFVMGSTSRIATRGEQPVTRVRISKGFYLGKYEVTQDQWQAVMGDNPSGSTNCGGNCPVDEVSWEDVQVFIGRLNERSTGGRYRLPTDAEWEYAARAGTKTDTYAGDIINPFGNDPVLNGIAWYSENSGLRPHPVGGKAPNAWGLHDMVGNVWEWVEDWYGPYPGGAVTDPAGPESGSYRVNRGGSAAVHFDTQMRTGVRARDQLRPGNRLYTVGFRLLREE